MNKITYYKNVRKMKLKKVVMNVKHSEKRIAVLEDNQLVEWFSSADTNSFVGNIYLGKITDVLPKLNAVFIDIGLNKNGFMRFEDTIQGKENESGSESGEALRKTFQKGQFIFVQVIKDAFDEKGPKLTNNLELSGDYVVYLPYTKQVAVSSKIRKESIRNKLYSLGRAKLVNQDGVIFRSSCEDGNLDEITNELSLFQEQINDFHKLELKKISCVWEANSLFKKFFKLHPPNTIHELIVDDLLACKKELPQVIEPIVFRGKENIFDAYQIENQIEKSFKNIVWLKNGSFLIIEQTEALTVIDVNTGKFIGKQNRDETVFQTNQLAANEISRQLRLRDIGGMVIIDFINMQSPDMQNKITELLKASFRDDRATTKLFGFTSLGLFELTRKRTAHSHLDATHQKCPICKGLGFIKTAEQITFELERKLWEEAKSDDEAILVECCEDVAALLKGQNNEHLSRLEKALFMKIFIKIVDSNTHYYKIIRKGSKNEIMG